MVRNSHDIRLNYREEDIRMEGSLKEERISHLISRVYATEDVELGCDQVQSLLPWFVEADVDGADASESSPVRAHLEQCPDCEATYQGLRAVLEAELLGGELPAPEESLSAWEPQEQVVSRTPSS